MKQFSLKKYLENPNKKVITRDRRSVRIICTNRINRICEYPLVALVSDEGAEVLLCYTKDGKLYENKNDGRDLFFATEKKEGWINVRKNETRTYTTGTIYSTRDEAIMADLGMTNYIDTVKIKWEE